MSSQPRPQFFCARPNGTLTPLIAVDELPPNISLRGVPRTLSPNETQGMTSLGTVPSRAQVYVIDGVTATTTRTSANAGPRTRDFDLQTSLMRLIADENVPANQRLALNTLLQQGISQNWFAPSASSSGWLVPSGSGGTTAGSSRQGAHYNAKKEYCSYWIRHGECDYQQQGCLYKHEMPNDLSTLEKLGLRDIPRWYREKYGIPSLLPNGHGHPRQQWKDDVADRGAMKSIQYPTRLDHSGSANSSDVEKSSKQKATLYLSSQQHPGTLSGPSRNVYATANSPKVATHPKQAPKNQVNPISKRIDLLSFDPLREFSSMDQMGGGVSLPYHGSPEGAPLDNADRAQHEEFLRNVQSLMSAPVSAGTDCMSSPFENASNQARSKKAQKSRRLYQTRAQMAMHDLMGKCDQDTPGAYIIPAATTHSTFPKDPISSQLASPIADLTHGGSVCSEPPTRGASPSTHSSASFSSRSSPRVLRSHFGEKDTRVISLQAPIGTKKSYTNKPAGTLDDA
ncbi:hypothetical protein BDV25DRAFT_141249 [Aspergillus avenaceus]|uniref:C3H1-type domain-containing protein n=1 Tax=Aspergillus avenaceus TaxID=36643 RepID=A0A5N6TRR8_ASPAV|nr:hypothetical protein BDV25DRAFT_141249 [Aspergillus avenaceus]